MIDLLKKDIVGEVNPYLFQKIQTKINDRQRGNIPAWSVVTLKYGLAALALLMVFNVYSIFSPKEDSQKQEIAYNKFVEDNYFDVLASTFGSEVLFPE